MYYELMKRGFFMSLERAKTHLKKWDLEEKILEFPTSSATVELAAKALNCEEERIAKTLSFKNESGCILIVAAGDAKVDNKKFKEEFGMKANMLKFDEVEELTGHSVGGVCPFGVKDGAEVYLDESLKRFKTVFPACGTENSAIELSIEELEICSEYLKWVDVCKGWKIYE